MDTSLRRQFDITKAEATHGVFRRIKNSLVYIGAWIHDERNTLRFYYFDVRPSNASRIASKRGVFSS